MWSGYIGNFHEYLHQRHINVVVETSDFVLLDEATCSEVVEILGCGETGDLQVVLQRLDLSVRVREQIVEKILAVDLWQLRSDAVLVIHHDCLDAANYPNRLLRGLFHAPQHIEYPWFPVAGIPGLLKQAVVFRFRLDHERPARIPSLKLSRSGLPV